MILEARHWLGVPDPSIAKARKEARNAYWWWSSHPGYSPSWMKEVAEPLAGLNPQSIMKLDRSAAQVISQAIERLKLPPETAMKREIFEEINSQVSDCHDMADVCSRKRYLHNLNNVPRLAGILAMMKGLHLGKEHEREMRLHARNDFFRYFHSYLVWNYGEQIFRILPALSEKLVLTDVKDLKWDDLKLPFPAFVIELPEPLFYCNNIDTGLHPIDTVMVCRVKNVPSAEDALEAQKRMEERLREDPHDLNPDRTLGFTLTDGISLSFWAQENENSKGFMDDDFSFVTMGKPRNGELKTVVDMLVGDISRAGGSGITLFSESGADVYRELIQYVVNIILYINSRPDDVIQETNPRVKEIHTLLGKKPAKGKRKKLLAELKSLTKHPRPLVVGTKVVIDKKLSREARNIGLGRKPSVASYVRGHIRNQAHGPRLSLRKLIWIEPHWRNIDAEVTSQKNYTVK